LKTKKLGELITIRNLLLWKLEFESNRVYLGNHIIKILLHDPSKSCFVKKTLHDIIKFGREKKNSSLVYIIKNSKYKKFIVDETLSLLRIALKSSNKKISVIRSRIEVGSISHGNGEVLPNIGKSIFISILLFKNLEL